VSTTNEGGCVALSLFWLTSCMSVADLLRRTEAAARPQATHARKKKMIAVHVLLMWLWSRPLEVSLYFKYKANKVWQSIPNVSRKNIGKTKKKH
jgi:hypothetical protein